MIFKFLSVYDVLNWIDANLVWGIPLIVLILVVGIWLTSRLGGLQIFKVGRSLKAMVNNSSEGQGEVSTFGALCISMAATLGTGKIIGVATGIYWGGPGALFWMIIAAIFGMATKYAEGFLAVKYRNVNADGSVSGGPFAYIENGMGKKWSWLAKFFCIFGALAGALGIGTMTQINSITESVNSVFDPNAINTINVFGNNLPLVGIIVGLIVTIVYAFALIGGINRISKVSAIIVPVMAIGFFLVSFLVVLFNIPSIPSAIATILKDAFTLKAGLGATAGIGIMIAMREGVSKGIFSNEAGLGSAPIVIASGKSNDPVEQGLVCMGSTFIDTMVLCLTIGLGVVITGTYQDYEGIDITINTFSLGLHISKEFSAVIVMLCIFTFAFTTIIGWNVYGEKCVDYLFKGSKKAVFIYKIFYITAVAIAPFLTLNVIWKIASICNGLMALPNLIAILVLSGVVVKETKEYFKKEKEEKVSSN